VTDTDVEQQVRAGLMAMVEALNNGDRNGVAASLSTRVECTLIGSDPEEWLTGDQLLAVMDQGMLAGDSPVRVVLDDTFVHVMGEVAWVEGRGRFIDPTSRERPYRMTAVVVREDGEWKGVQSHVSLGVPNDQIFA
jgi:hypothetical protein